MKKENVVGKHLRKEAENKGGATMEHKQIIKGEYVFTPCKNAFNAKTSYWLSKRGYTLSTYAFTPMNATDLSFQLDNADAYINHYENVLHNANKSSEIKNLACEIVDMFDDMLDQKDITVPDEDDDQKDADNSARLYGMTYWTLVDQVQEMLDNEIFKGAISREMERHDRTRDVEEYLRGLYESNNLVAWKYEYAIGNPVVIEEILILFDKYEDCNTAYNITMEIVVEKVMGAIVLDDSIVEYLWERFGDILVDDEECILDDFIGFNAGVNKEAVWSWFNKHYSKGIAALINKQFYTWDDLYQRAEGAACGEPELNAKDNARWILTEIIKEITGVDVDECEIPEEAIEKFLEESDREYLFDEDGNLREA